MERFPAARPPTAHQGRAVITQRYTIPVRIRVWHSRQDGRSTPLLPKRRQPPIKINKTPNTDPHWWIRAKSAKLIVANGPDRIRVRSSTCKPASAPSDSVFAAGHSTAPASIMG